jgi:glycosyltransferase involved in cell wall biosynthesis
MQDALLDYGVRCPMHIIPTGLEMSQFVANDPAAFRERLGIAPGQPTLVHVGRVAHEKNIDFLLRMLRRLREQRPDVVFILAGEGPALEHCKAQVEKLDLTRNVRFVGYLSRQGELWDCYRAGDVFVFASRTETQGLVLLEAMALGVPVVSTAHMGTVDIMKPERGAITAPDDEQGFAAIVAQLLQEPQRRAKLAAEAPEYAATWSAAAMADKLIDLYGDLARAHREARIPPAAATQV